MAKLKVDKNKCIGCGACISTCPKLFKYGSDSKSEVIKENLNEEETKCAKEAANTCPVDAIEIEEE